MTSHDGIDSLKDFFRNEPLNKIAISRAFHELWKHNDIQSEENDCNGLLEILNELMAENLDNDRKQHLISLQDVDKMRDMWKGLKLLADAGVIRFETEEPPSWKQHAIYNIGNLRDKLQRANTSIHDRLLGKICTSDVNDLTYDDPLANGIIDLGSPQYQIIEDDYEVLVGEKNGIKKLTKDPLVREACADFITKRDEIRDEIRNRYKFIISSSELLSHGHWVERGTDRMQVAVNVTDILLQEIKRNVLRRVSGGSENVLVDAITRLMEASLYQVPIDFDIEVTRNERQSMASKERKTKQVIGSRGNRPDLMIRVFFKRRWNELAYLESGKWKSTDTKSHNDHNKLARFCVDGYVAMSKKINKNELYKFCITFGINITDEHFIVIHGLLRENGIKFYLPIAKAKIPFHNASLEEVEDFVHALLVLRNGILVNLQGISRTFVKKSNSTQQNEDSSEDDSVIKTPER